MHQNVVQTQSFASRVPVPIPDGILTIRRIDIKTLKSIKAT